MIIVGLTGGIGSGKTTIAKQFEEIGIPIYIADEEAKKMMLKSKVIKRKLVKLFGPDAYINGELNKSFIAETIFNDKIYLEKMNAIVHPQIAKHFNTWVLKQDAPYVIKEAAILFENGSYKEYDYIITVIAPKDIRIKRLLKRNNTTKEKIEAIIKNQWTDEDKVKLSHYVIENTTLRESRNQVLDIHAKILKSLN